LGAFGVTLFPPTLVIFAIRQPVGVIVDLIGAVLDTVRFVYTLTIFAIHQSITVIVAPVITNLWTGPVAVQIITIYQAVCVVVFSVIANL